MRNALRRLAQAILRDLRDQRGSTFIEQALWIIVVVLLVAGAGYSLAKNGIQSKIDEIRNSVTRVTVPDIGAGAP